jgi:hypothetical protein
METLSESTALTRHSRLGTPSDLIVLVGRSTDRGCSRAYIDDLFFSASLALPHM